MNKKRYNVFQRSQYQITAVIMATFLLLFAVTLAAIYIISYHEMYFKNLNMMEIYTEVYRTNGNPSLNRNNNEPLQEKNSSNTDTMSSIDSTRYLLTYFYSVAFDENRQAYSIDTGSGILYTQDNIRDTAEQLLNAEQNYGIREKFVYYISHEETYTLVVLMDNTLISDSFNTMFRNTLFIGSAMVVILFFIAIALSRRIIRPLKESDARQRQFISDAGHELKTPVSVIEANAELLEREVGNNKWLDNIRSESSRMAELVSELLALVRAERDTPQTELLDFSRLVMGIVLPFESIAFEMGRELEYQIDENITVEGNAGELNKLMSILMDNALSYSEGMGNIKITLFSKKTGVILTVSNPGFIPEDKRDEIFARFFRIDTNRGGAGHYGLGLTIAKSIVIEHNGEIYVTCSDGRVEFSVYLHSKP